MGKRGEIVVLTEVGRAPTHFDKYETLECLVLVPCAYFGTIIVTVDDVEELISMSTTF